jgi:hypothetical protein
MVCPDRRGIKLQNPKDVWTAKKDIWTLSSKNSGFLFKDLFFWTFKVCEICENIEMSFLGFL